MGRITQTSLFSLSLQSLSDVILRASYNGNDRELVLLSTVCKRFKEAVSCVPRLSLSCPSEEYDIQHVLSHAILLTPRLQELECWPGDDLPVLEIEPETILFWSSVIGKTLKSLTINNGGIGAVHMRGFSGFKALEYLSLHECCFELHNEELFDCPPMLSVKAINLFEPKTTEKTLLGALFVVFPRLQTVSYSGIDSEQIQDLVIKSTVLTSLKLSSNAEKTTIEAPNLTHLHVNDESWKHFVVGEVKNLLSLKLGNLTPLSDIDIDDNVYLKVTMQNPLPSKLQQVHAGYGVDSQTIELLWTLIRNSFGSIKTLTICESAFGCNTLPLFPQLQKLTLYPELDEEPAEYIDRVKSWLTLCPAITELEVGSKDFFLSEFFADTCWNMQEILASLSQLDPNIKCICEYPSTCQGTQKRLVDSEEEEEEDDDDSSGIENDEEGTGSEEVESGDE